MIVCEAFYYIKRFGSILTREAEFWMILPLAALILLWLKVRRMHQDTFEAHLDHANSGEVGYRSDELLDDLAYMSYAGLSLAMFAVGCAYLALAYLGSGASAR